MKCQDCNGSGVVENKSPAIDSHGQFASQSWVRQPMAQLIHSEQWHDRRTRHREVNSVPLICSRSTNHRVGG